MKIRKFSAFTLAELLVIMAVLAVLMAAFAPVFTSRYTNMAAGSVWSAVPGDNSGHIYFDEPNKLLSQQAFMGVTPEDSEIAKSEFQPYSKLIITPTIRANGYRQGQLAFMSDITLGNNVDRWGNRKTDSDTDLYGFLSIVAPYGAAMNIGGDVILGGPIRNTKSSFFARYGEALYAANELNIGYKTTALGADTLNPDEAYGLRNCTGIGARALSGQRAGNTSRGQVWYPQFLGEEIWGKSMYKRKTEVIDLSNGIAGIYASNRRDENNLSPNGPLAAYAGRPAFQGYDYSIETENGPVAVLSLDNIGPGMVIGAGTNQVRNDFLFYREIGLPYSPEFISGHGARRIESTYNSYFAKDAITIGYGSGDVSGGVSNPRNGTRGGSCFISSSGRVPNSVSLSDVFESSIVIRGTRHHHDEGYHVYIGNVTNFGPAALEVHVNGPDFMPNPTVIVNGDLIVRGQSFFNTNLTYPGTGAASNRIVAHGLQTNDNTGFNPLVPWASHKDRQYKNRRLMDDRRYMLPNFGAEETCQCTVGNNQSYDWTNPTDNEGSYLYAELYSGGNHYHDYMVAPGSTVLNAAHNYDETSGSSCCPNLFVSDARLKNIGEKFTPSYDELLKLAIYNYSYKTEGKKPTHVGVIAQDLKKIFPNAVSKDQNGYLKIRWDEMFYAMVNAVKDLNVKVQNLIAKVETNKTKINNLKVDNKKLEQKLDDLAQEIAKLEK